MTDQELARIIKIFALTTHYEMDEIHPIHKSELKNGQRYLGSCRNSDVAIWNGERFEYHRFKFGEAFKEEINHYEDDNGYDVFVPFMELP